MGNSLVYLGAGASYVWFPLNLKKSVAMPVPNTGKYIDMGHAEMRPLPLPLD